MDLFPDLTPEETENRLAAVNDKLQWLLLLEHKHNCTIEVGYRPEDQQIEGNARAVADGKDEEYNAAIVQELRKGNEWAWCIVVIEVTDPELEGFVVAETLGGCCYRDREDFIINSGYLEDMVDTAIKALDTQRENVKRILKQRDDKILEMKQDDNKIEQQKEDLGISEVDLFDPGDN